MMNSNMFFWELSKAHQEEVKELLKQYYIKEGYSEEETKELISNAIENRLWVLSEAIDIEPFLKEGKVIKLR